MRIRSYLAVAAATAFLACSGSDGGPTDPGAPDDRTFSPTTDTELSGSVDFDEVSIPEGVTVNVTGDLTLTVAGPIVIAGDLVGDCVGIDLVGSAEVTIEGRIVNTCSSPPTDPPGISITGDGEMVFDGAFIETSGGIASRNDPGLSLEPTTAGSPLRLAQDAPRLLFTRSELRIGQAASGEDAVGERVFGGVGQGAGSIVKASSGEIFFLGGVVLWTGDGGRGGHATAQSSTQAEALSGSGGTGGNIFLKANQVRFFTGQGGESNFFRTGDGGRGGDALATGLKGGPGPNAATALAEASRGGFAGAVFGSVTTVQLEPGALRIHFGEAGAGGEAIAVGADGVDATTAEPAQFGGSAHATGGNGGEVFAWIPDGAEVQGGKAGPGGTASAHGGKGGDGIPGIHPDGAGGGFVMARGGDGGAVQTRRPGATSAARLLIPAQDPETLSPGPGAAASHTGGRGGDGGNACGDPESFDAVGMIAVGSDPAGSDDNLFDAGDSGTDLALRVALRTASGAGGDGGRGGSVIPRGGFLEIVSPGGGRGGSSEYTGTTAADAVTLLDQVGNGGSAGAGTPPGAPGPPGALDLGPDADPMNLNEPSFASGTPAGECATGALIPAQSGSRQITIAGDAPWIDVTGTLAEDGTVTAEGTGMMVGFPGVKATFEGTFADGRLQGDYAMDTEKKVSSGHPIVYTVDVQQQ